MFSKQLLCTALIIFILSVPTMCDWEDRKGPPPVVYLSQLVENPQAWLDVPVKIPLRFSGIRQIYTAYFTQFDRDRDLNFSAWDIHTHIWQKKGFMNDYPFFYVEKRGKESKAFLRLKKFDSITVMGKIVSIFRGKPYFKIVWVCKQPGQLNIHNLTLLNKASTAFQNRMFDDAISHYNEVATTNPPRDIKAMIHKVKANIFLYHKTDYKAANMEIKRGLRIAKKDPQLLQMSSQCEYYMKNGGTPQPVMVNIEEKNFFEEEAPVVRTELPQYSSNYKTAEPPKKETVNYDQYIEKSSDTSDKEEFSEKDEEEYSENDDYYEDDEELSEDDEEEFSEDDFNDSSEDEFVEDEEDSEFSEDDSDVDDRE